jgi:hypothetical protein
MPDGIEKPFQIPPVYEAGDPSIRPFFFFFAISAQKSHVKPGNHLKPYDSTTSAWHVSSSLPAIMDIEIRKEKSPEGVPRGIFL